MKKRFKRGVFARNIAKKTEKAASIKNIWFIFMLISMAVLAVAVFTTTTLASLVNRWLDVNIEITIYGWIVLFSIIIGGVMSFLIGKIIFIPILKLSGAMKRVASGDFSVRMNTKSSVNEISSMLENFNIMTKELAATEVLQSDFVSNVSHEFKTPIGVIEGYATLLQDDVSDAERREYADKIILNTQRLSDLVGNVLLLSKVENQNISSKNETFRLDEQIRRCIVMLSPKWERKNIEFDASLKEVSYLGNDSLLQHVWINLIDNAIKFNRVGGKIYIDLKEDDGKIVVSVADEGCGISVEDKSHLYDKFYQCDSSHKSEGNGLGLSLVKKILDCVGGGINCDNRSEGGAIFAVTLPVKK